MLGKQDLGPRAVVRRQPLVGARVQNFHFHRRAADHGNALRVTPLVPAARLAESARGLLHVPNDFGKIGGKGTVREMVALSFPNAARESSSMPENSVPGTGIEPVRGKPPQDFKSFAVKRKCFIFR